MERVEQRTMAEQKPLSVTSIKMQLGKAKKGQNQANIDKYQKMLDEVLSNEPVQKEPAKEKPVLDICTQNIIDKMDEIASQSGVNSAICIIGGKSYNKETILEHYAIDFPFVRSEVIFYANGRFGQKLVN